MDLDRPERRSARRAKPVPARRRTVADAADRGAGADGDRDHAGASIREASMRIPGSADVSSAWISSLHSTVAISGYNAFHAGGGKALFAWLPHSTLAAFLSVSG